MTELEYTNRAIPDCRAGAGNDVGIFSRGQRANVQDHFIMGHLVHTAHQWFSVGRERFRDNHVPGNWNRASFCVGLLNEDLRIVNEIGLIQ